MDGELAVVAYSYVTLYLEYLVLLGWDTLHLYNLIIIHNSIRNINTSPQII